MKSAREVQLENELKQFIIYKVDERNRKKTNLYYFQKNIYDSIKIHFTHRIYGDDKITINYSDYIENISKKATNALLSYVKEIVLQNQFNDIIRHVYVEDNVSIVIGYVL